MGLNYERRDAAHVLASQRAARAPLVACYALYPLGILTSKSVTPKSTLSCDNSVETCPR